MYAIYACKPCCMYAMHACVPCSHLYSMIQSHGHFVRYACTTQASGTLCWTAYFIKSCTELFSVSESTFGSILGSCSSIWRTQDTHFCNAVWKSMYSRRSQRRIDCGKCTPCLEQQSPYQRSPHPSSLRCPKKMRGKPVLQWLQEPLNSDIWNIIIHLIVGFRWKHS